MGRTTENSQLSDEIIRLKNKECYFFTNIDSRIKLIVTQKHYKKVNKSAQEESIILVVQQDAEDTRIVDSFLVIYKPKGLPYR